MKIYYTLILLFITIGLNAQIACDWAYVPAGPSQTYHTIYISTTDLSGNIIQLGKNLGNADMDPSPLPGDTSFCYAGFNYYVSSTADSGKLNWIRYFEDNSQIGQFEFKGLQVNSQNEIIILGDYFGLIDFDLSSTGVDTLRSHAPTYPDYFVAKYDSLGNYVFAISIGDAARNIQSHTLAVMDNDNILVVANPSGPIDVDPSPNTNNTIGGNANIVCYDADGKYLWNNNIGVLNSYGVTCKSLDSDSDRNSYLFNVGYYELTASKFNGSGVRLWDKTIGDFGTGARVEPQSVLVDKLNGGFYVAGTFQGTVDFDPGVATVNKTSSSGFNPDGFVAKYDSSMNLIWVNHYVGKVSFGKYTLEFDSSNLVLSGNFEGTIDFGSGNILIATATTLPFFLKINPLGSTISIFALGGAGVFNTLNTSINNKYIVTGYIAGNTDMDPSLRTLIINSTTNNYFTAVYENSSPTGLNLDQAPVQLIAFPNPVQNETSIQFDKSFIGKNYLILDVSGRIISRNKIESILQKVSLSNNSNGFYTLQIENNLSSAIKLLKQ
jgi:hypothetical protein